MGFWLKEPTFNHWQLNVATSKVGDPQHHYSAVNKNVRIKTRNVVYI